MKPTFEQVSRMTYGRCIASIDWPFFARTMVIELEGDPALRLTLQAVHFCSFRQSLLCRDMGETVEGCEIYSFQMLQEHPFLNQWIEKRLETSSVQMIYDTAGAKPGDSAFRRPFYLYLVLSVGHLDVIFESWEIAT